MEQVVQEVRLEPEHLAWLLFLTGGRTQVKGGTVRLLVVPRAPEVDRELDPALESLSPEERRKVYVILNLTVEAFADGSLKISCAFGEETPVWEDGRTSTR